MLGRTGRCVASTSPQQETLPRPSACLPRGLQLGTFRARLTSPKLSRESRTGSLPLGPTGLAFRPLALSPQGARATPIPHALQPQHPAEKVLNEYLLNKCPAPVFMRVYDKYFIIVTSWPTKECQSFVKSNKFSITKQGQEQRKASPSSPPSPQPRAQRAAGRAIRSAPHVHRCPGKQVSGCRSHQ